MATTKASIRTDRYGEITEVFLPLNPVPASRPKIGRYGAYYGKRYSSWKHSAESMFSLLAVGVKPTDDDFHVAVHSVVLKPRTGTLPHPLGDVDNFVKAPLDALTKAQLLWHDDKQVVTLLATKRYSLPDETPHTYIRSATSLSALWMGDNGHDPIGGWVAGEDVYDLPPSFRVPFDWYKEIST